MSSVDTETCNDPDCEACVIGRDAVLQRREAFLKDPGWNVIGLTDAPIAYTLGLAENFNYPEIVVFGIPVLTAHALLNHIGFMVKKGEAPPLYTRLADVADGGYRPMLIPYDGCDDHVAQALFRMEDTGKYPPEPLPRVLQYVYPDREHRMPWEPGVSESFQAGQHHPKRPDAALLPN